jgi:hypothetical protein
MGSAWMKGGWVACSLWIEVGLLAWILVARYPHRIEVPLHLVYLLIAAFDSPTLLPALNTVLRS